MPITLDKAAEKVIQAHPKIAEEVTAYALYLANVQAKHSGEATEILKDAVSLASQDERTWEERSEELEGILDEVAQKAC